MMRRLTTAILFLLLPTTGASAASETLIVAGGTVHPVVGDPFVGDVVIEDGRIVAAAADADAPQGAARIDAAGLHVYPGLFDALSTLGLLEVGAVSATDDQAEMGTYNPHLEAITAIHPASEVIPVTRANGITHALVSPRADREGVIAGQAAAVHLTGWTVDEMAIEPTVAMVVRWPRIVTRRFDRSTFSIVETPYSEAKEKADEAREELREWFEAARQYRQALSAGSERLEYDPKLAALARCLDGGLPVVIQAETKRDIKEAVAFAETEGLRMILAGGGDAWEVADLLAEKDVPVILQRTLSLPEEEDLPYDMPYRNPGVLVEAGVRIAFASAAGGGFGPSGPHSSRTVPYEALAAVPFGLAEEDALRAVTIEPARMFGLDDRLGSIEPGKIANLIVTDGSPLEIRTRIVHLVIDGREVSTDNLHRSLYETYRAR